MRKYETADLVGKILGCWRVLAFEGVEVTSERGGGTGLRTGPAKRATWLVECTVCETRLKKNTSYITRYPAPVHQPCRKKFAEQQKSEILRDAAAIFGGTE